MGMFPISIYILFTFPSHPRLNSRPYANNHQQQNSQHRSIFAYTYMDDSILDTGYIDWSKSEPRYNNLTLQAEYRNFGPGFDVRERRESRFDRLLSEREWREYSSPGKVFQTREGKFGETGWIDWGV